VNRFSLSTAQTGRPRRQSDRVFEAPSGLVAIVLASGPDYPDVLA